jgi:DNA-binding MarR family transcriptional regulator
MAPAGVNSSQFSILSVVEHSPGITVAELAGALVMDRTTLVRALQPLQRSGLVVSEPPPRGHAHRLFVTQLGKAKLSEAFPLWSAAQQQFEAEFGKDRAQAMREILSGLPRI